MDKSTEPHIGRIGPSFPRFATSAASTADVGGAHLAYSVCGADTLVMVFHGGLGLDHTYLRPWLDPLCGCSRLVFHDLRGHGRSTGRQTLGRASHATFVNDADALRAHLGVDRMVVFGHSYGGFLALEYALRYPDRVSGLVLCSTSASLAHMGASLEIARERGTEQEFAALHRAFSAPAADDTELARTWQVLVPLYFHDGDAALEPFARITFSAPGYNLGVFTLLPSYDLTPRLHEILAPALVLSGSHDWLMPPHLAGTPLSSQLQAARHVVFERSGHFPFIEENEAFTTIVDGWLRDLRA